MSSQLAAHFQLRGLRLCQPTDGAWTRWVAALRAQARCARTQSLRLAMGITVLGCGAKKQCDGTLHITRLDLPLGRAFADAQDAGYKQHG